MGARDQKWALDSNFWRDEWMNLAVFLHALLGKVKNYLNSCWVAMVKHVCGLLAHGTLKFFASQEWMNEVSWFFACSYIVMEAKS